MCLVVALDGLCGSEYSSTWTLGQEYEGERIIVTGVGVGFSAGWSWRWIARRAVVAERPVWMFCWFWDRIADRKMREMSPD